MKPNQSLWRHFGDTMSLENRSIFQLMKKGHLWHSPWVENGCCFIHQSDLVHDPPKKPLSHVLKLHNGPIFGNQARSPSSSTTLCHCCRRSYVGRVFTLHGITFDPDISLLLILTGMGRCTPTSGSRQFLRALRGGTTNKASAKL